MVTYIVMGWMKETSKNGEWGQEVIRVNNNEWHYSDETLHSVLGNLTMYYLTRYDKVSIEILKE
jgi:hypothetical protein